MDHTEHQWAWLSNEAGWACLFCDEHQYWDDVVDRPCGCPSDYHMADCPHKTGSYGPATKDEWYDLLTDDD